MYKLPLLSSKINILYKSVLSLGLFFMTTSLASAHTGAGVIGGFLSGFTHPLYGFDHVVAMVAVGIWGAYLGKKAIWTLPLIFPFVMAIGGAFGVLGFPLPYVEVGIALSGVVLGGAILIGYKANLKLAWALVAIFAIFHGYAHGAELPEAANPLAYSVGFVLATGLLHLAGIGIGYIREWKKYGDFIVRFLGAIIMLVGFAFLFGIL